MPATGDRKPPKATEDLLLVQERQLRERIKELNCLFTIAELAGDADRTLPELLQGTVDRLPLGWQFPEIACARLVLEGLEFKTTNFGEPCVSFSAAVQVNGQTKGSLELGYLEEKVWGEAGPFLREEKNLLEAAAKTAGRMIERKQAEAALRESEKRFRVLFEQAAVGVAQIETASGRFVGINRRYCEIAGYSEEEMKALTFQEITHPEDLRADLENMRRLSNGEIREFTMEKRYFHKSGRIVWVTLTVSPMWAPGEPPDFHIAVVQDISARKHFEERVHGLSQQLLRGQEEERRRISRELHDGIGQNLSAIKVGLDSQVLNKLEWPAETKEKAQALSRLLGETIEGLRDMAHTLRPAGLEQLGLVKAVIQFCEEFEAKNRIAVDLVTAGIDDRALDYDTRIALYRLVQEGLINIKKHAEATRASIRLVSSFPNLILRIEDDGCGFDVKKRKEAGGVEKRLGLSSMEERVSLLAGLMKIESQPGRGTRIAIEIPVANPFLGEGHGD